MAGPRGCGTGLMTAAGKRRSGRRPGRQRRQPDAGRHRQDALRRVRRPLLPRAGSCAWPSSAAATAATAGRNDEALVLEENLPDVPHLQGADRVALARDRRRGAGERGPGPRRRLPAPPAGPRPRPRADRRDRPVGPRLPVPARPAARAAREPASGRRRRADPLRPGASSRVRSNAPDARGHAALPECRGRDDAPAR